MPCAATYTTLNRLRPLELEGFRVLTKPRVWRNNGYLTSILIISTIHPSTMDNYQLSAELSLLPPDTTQCGTMERISLDEVNPSPDMQGFNKIKIIVNNTGIIQYFLAL